MINVIYLVSRLKVSGPTNQAFNIVTGMDKDECRMIVVTLSPEFKKTRLPMYQDAGIEVIQLNRRDWDILGCVRDLKRIIKERHIDIVHSSGDRADMCNHFLRSVVPTVSTLRSEVENIAERKGFLVRKIVSTIHKHNIKTVHYAVACSNFLKESIKQSTGRDVQVIHNCVNTTLFTPAIDKAEAKQKVGLDPSSKVFIALGSLIRRKNNDILLDYFSSCQGNEVFVVAGDGELDEEYKSRYKSPKIKFVGRVDSLPYLQAADYLVSASLSEGLPNTVLEALACGVPVVLSDIGPHEEIIKEGDVGCIFDKTSTASLETAINQISNQDYKNLSALCRYTAENKFSVAYTSNSYYRLYQVCK